MTVNVGSGVEGINSPNIPVNPNVIINPEDVSTPTVYDKFKTYQDDKDTVNKVYETPGAFLDELIRVYLEKHPDREEKQAYPFLLGALAAGIPEEKRESYIKLIQDFS